MLRGITKLINRTTIVFKFRVNSPESMNNEKIRATVLLLSAICFSSYLLPLATSGQALAQVNQFNPNQNNGGFSNPQQQPSNSGESSYLTYQSPNLGFSIKYPANSQVIERQDGVQMGFPDGSMLVMVHKFNMTLSELSQGFINAMGLTGQNVRQGDATLAGYPSHYVSFTNSTDGTFTTFSLVMVGNTSYLVEYIFNHDAPRDLIYNVVHSGVTSFQVSASQPGFGNQQ